MAIIFGTVANLRPTGEHKDSPVSPSVPPA